MTTLVRGERPGLTGWEQALRVAAGIVALASVGFALEYAILSRTTASEFPFTTNSIAAAALIAGLGVLAILDVRRWGTIAVPLLILVHAVLATVLGLTALFGTTHGVAHTWDGLPVSAATFQLVWAVSVVLTMIVFAWLQHMAIRSRYDLQYLTPAGFRALMAISEVLVLREDPEVRPAEVGRTVDLYLASFRATGKWKIAAAFVLLAYRPLVPLHLMSADLRLRWVRRHFIEDVARRRVPEFLRELDQTLIRLGQQFAFFGYYGDERGARKAGYVPFSQLPGSAAAVARDPRPHRRVSCLTPSGEKLTADVVIVGSGAGGAMLAYELARRGREVLLLERGAHIDPQDFTENEGTQLSNLYADGALTLSRDFRLHVAQGMCVGGSTVVNNAVCFDLPHDVRERWLAPDGLNAGLDRDRLGAAFRYVREFLRVDRVGPPASLNPGAARILAGLADCAPWGFQLTEANIDGCLGCGYCNIGCRFGRKLSALDWTLPRAQHDFPGAVRILADCEVLKVRMHGARASGVSARLTDGTRLDVAADTVVASAGALASSVLLQRSGLGEGRAGRRLAFNLGSPVTLDFPEAIHSERGLQISHYLLPDGAAGVALETWYNPIVSQSLFMPGWFEQHWANMRRYAYMTCLGVVIGTESNASVSASRLGGVNLDYHPTDGDFVRLKDGVRLASRVGLAAGAERALPASYRMIEIHNEDDLSRIDLEIGDDSDLSVNSSHPQGGNPISLDALRGVVDPSFRVYGTTNVHVCDASVFPSSITVNPQLTVMALAAYAAEEIAGAAPHDAAPQSAGVA